MAMASVSVSCMSFVSPPYKHNTAHSPEQSSVAVAQQVPCRTLGLSLVPRECSCSAIVGFGRLSKQGSRNEQPRMRRNQQHWWRVDAGLKETALTEQKWGPPVTLGTAQLPLDVDLKKLEKLLYQVSAPAFIAAKEHSDFHHTKPCMRFTLRSQFLSKLAVSDCRIFIAFACL
jgi:hypothetical protein